MVTQVNFGNIVNTGGKQTVSGISSGLDSKALIESLTTLKRAPAVQLETKIETIGKQSTAYNELKTLVEAFRDSADLLRNPPGVANQDKNIFTYRTANIRSNTSISGESYVSVTAQPNANVNNYSITDITSLAQAKKQKSDELTVASLDADFVVATATTAGQIGAGTIGVNGASITLELNDSLQDVINKFNAVKDTTGIAASAVQVSAGKYRMVFTATETGVDADFDLESPTTVTSDPSGALSQITFGLIQNAANAEFQIDGLPVVRQTNEIDDLVDGVSFTLRQTTNGAPTTAISIEIDPDTEVAKAAITRFVDDYNNLRLFVSKQTEVDTSGKPKDSAVLSSSQSLRALLSTVTSELANAVAGITGGDPNKLSDLGIKFSDYAGDDKNPFTRNILTMDDATLDTKLNGNFQSVANMFGFNSSTTVSGLQVFNRTNGLNTNSFTVSLNTTTDTYTATVNGQTYAFEAKEISGGGVSLLGPSNSPIAGLQMIYTGAGLVSGSVSVTQGLGDRIFNALDNMLDEDVGAISVELETITTRTERFNEEIARIDAQIETYRQTLLDRFSAMEAAIAKVNSVLQSLDAQAQARNSGS